MDAALDFLLHPDGGLIARWSILFFVNFWAVVLCVVISWRAARMKSKCESKEEEIAALKEALVEARSAKTIAEMAQIHYTAEITRWRRIDELLLAFMAVPMWKDTGVAGPEGTILNPNFIPAYRALRNACLVKDDERIAS